MVADKITCNRFLLWLGMLQRRALRWKEKSVSASKQDSTISILDLLKCPQEKVFEIGIPELSLPFSSKVLRFKKRA